MNFLIFLLQNFALLSISGDILYQSYLENAKIDIYAGGDVMLSRTVGYLNKKEGYDRVFGEYNPINDKSGGIAIFNLESPFSDPDYDVYERTFTFGANIANSGIIDELIGENIGIISLANNHIHNRGNAGLNLTKEILDEKEISYIGTLDNDFVEKIINGKKICVEAYSYDGNGKTIKYLSLDNIKTDLEKMSEKDCFLKIIVPHWGSEYIFSPNSNQRNLAHEIIDSGADIILGGHSHIPGEIEEYNNKLIIYSLGNYIFDQNWGWDYCQSSMDCIYDKNLEKETVPTYIGTLIHITVNLNKKIEIVKTINHKIDNGKVSEYEL